jgi:cyanate permease
VSAASAASAVLSAAAPRAPSRYRFVIEAVLFLTYAAFGVSWIAVTPLLPELGDALGARGAELALLNTAVSAAKIIAPLVGGWAALRFGVKRTILAGALCVLACAATPLCASLAPALAARFVFGLGGAVIVTLLGPAVMPWFSREELPLVNALNNVAVNTGIAVTLFSTVPLAARLGWRRTLLAYAAVNAACAVAWALLGRDRPRAAAVTAAAPSSSPARYRDVWRRRETWLLTMAFAAPLALYLALNTWLPSHAVAAFGLTREAAARLTGLVNLVGIPAAIAGGLLTRRLGRRRPFLIGAGLAVGTGSLAVVLSPWPEVRLAAAVVLGVGFFVAASPLLTTLMELPGVGPREVALMMGTLLSASYLVSSLSPLVVGWLHDHTGSYLPGLVGWSVAAYALAVAGALLPETGPRSR